MIDLAVVACPDMLDAVAFHGKLIVANSHDFSGQLGSTVMGSKQAFMHFLYQMVRLGGIYASKQSFIVVPLYKTSPLKKNWHAMCLITSSHYPWLQTSIHRS